MHDPQPRVKQMSFWGIGPSVIVPTFLGAAAAGVTTYVWPAWFAIRWPPCPALLATAAALVAIGLCLHVVAGRTLMKAYREDRLATTGVYALCRNPLYANIMFTFLPALALVCRSWLMLSASLVMYVLTRIHVRREEEYLEKRFGQEYLDYRRRTGAVLPTLRRR